MIRPFEVIVKGITWTIRVVYSDNAGVPINLTGYTAEFQIRDKIQGSLLYDMTQVSGIVITPLTGTLVLTISGAVTDTFNFSSGVYGLVVRLAGQTTLLLEGQLKVSHSVVE